MTRAARCRTRLPTVLALLVSALVACKSHPTHSQANAGNATGPAANIEHRSATPEGSDPRPARPEPPVLLLVPDNGHATDGRIAVLTDGDSAEAQRVAGWCHQVLVRLRDAFPPQALDAGLTVLVFAGRQRFGAYATRHAPENADVLGYYDPARREIVICRSSDSERTLLGTLIHECVHVALRDHLGTRYLPPWLDEGLASYYETARLEDDRLVTGQTHTDYARRVGTALRAGRRPGFRELATLGYRLFADPDRERMKQNYAVAWSLVWYMLHGDRGMHHRMLQLYLAEIAARPDRSTRYLHAFDLCLQPHADAMLAGWAAWASRIDELAAERDADDPAGHD